ncbi:unnamed protein product, partial [Mycena citricolor]
MATAKTQCGGRSPLVSFHYRIVLPLPVILIMISFRGTRGTHILHCVPIIDCLFGMHSENSWARLYVAVRFADMSGDPLYSVAHHCTVRLFALSYRATMQQSGIRTHQSRLVPRNRSSPSTICAAVSAPAVNCDSYEIFDVSSEDDMDLDRELELGFQQLAGDEQCAGVELGDGMDDLERKLQAEMERFEGAGSDNPMNETSTAWHGA